MFESNPTKSERIMEHIIIPRMKKFGDVTAMADAGEFDPLFVLPEIDYDLLQFKDDAKETMQGYVAQGRTLLESIDESDWNIENIKAVLWDWSGEVGRGNALHPIRTALSGMKQSPDPFTLAYILGKNDTLAQLGNV